MTTFLANPSPPASIMVVDDNPENLQLLSGLLHLNGFRVRAAKCGLTALHSIARELPDLVLLDTRMPDMDGYAVCRHLKEDERTRGIPVIFISGLHEMEDKIKAFDAGGADYITKPYHISEVLVRVNTQLTQMRLQRSLIQQNERLDETVRYRTAELLIANDRLQLLSRTKSDFLSLIAHELRTPLNGLLGATDLVFGEPPDPAFLTELHQIYESSRQRLLGLLDDAMLLGQIELNGRGVVGDIADLDSVMRLVQASAIALAPTGQKLPPFPTTGLGQVVGEPVLLQKALLCLLETGLKCVPPEAGGEITVTFHSEPDQVVITFTTLQFALSESDLAGLFEVLAVRKAFPGGDLGLAPPLAKRIITLLGGRVEAKNLAPIGLALSAWLPRPAGPPTKFVPLTDHRL